MARDVTIAVANVLIVLAIIPIWALVLAVGVYRRAPSSPATRERLVVSCVRVALGVGLALVGVQYDATTFLHHALYPTVASILIGVVILIGVDVPALLFVIRFYRH